MPTENCASDWDLPSGVRRRRPRKRLGISFEANQMMGKLGDDLLVEILIRLPNPRSACRCKSVCRRWNSLISSLCFNRRFVSHHQTMELHIPPMPGNPNELLGTILSFLPPMPYTLKVLDCVKDMVLCGFWDLDCDNGELGRSYLVCNPFTKQWVALPLAPEKSDGYKAPVARLVCEPRIAYNLDLGDEQAFVYSEYRFRVVCLYQHQHPNMQVSLKLDLFCLESNEWTKEALVLDGHFRRGTKSVSSCNGGLFWTYFETFPGGVTHALAMFNPFCLDIPPTCIDTSAFLAESLWIISVSQGDLHVITFEKKIASVCLIVWKMEEDRKSWRKLCEGVVKKKSRCCRYEIEDLFIPFLHPYNPEIVFFHCEAGQSALLYCDLRRGELELFAEIEGGNADICFVKVFEPRVSCWPTPIPSYEELQGMYNGSVHFWVDKQQLPQ